MKEYFVILALEEKGALSLIINGFNELGIVFDISNDKMFKTHPLQIKFIIKPYDILKVKEFLIDFPFLLKEDSDSIRKKVYNFIWGFTTKRKWMISYYNIEDNLANYAKSEGECSYIETSINMNYLDYKINREEIINYLIEVNNEMAEEDTNRYDIKMDSIVIMDISKKLENSCKKGRIEIGLGNSEGIGTIKVLIREDVLPYIHDIFKDAFKELYFKITLGFNYSNDKEDIVLSCSYPKFNEMSMWRDSHNYFLDPF